MSSGISHIAKNRANRRGAAASANRPRPSVPIGIVSATPSGSVLTIVFDQPVCLTGTPRYTLDNDPTPPVSAALTSRTTLALTYAAPVGGAASVKIPYEDPAIRNSSGGFVASPNYVF
ncbi:MAG TPA: hypothetical protein VH475_04325 [Tepidisphaeraceae bacterium]|jgi:hypothetical protein